MSACMGSLFLLVVLSSWTVQAASLGTFEGFVVQPGSGEPAGWLYVRGPSGAMRRLNIANAAVRYGDSVPLARRRDSRREIPPERWLREPGARVRVTAESDSNGQWIARDVVLLELPAIRIAAQVFNFRRSWGSGRSWARA